MRLHKDHKQKKVSEEVKSFRPKTVGHKF